MTTTCTRCHRPLSRPESQDRGYGPICAHRLHQPTIFDGGDQCYDLPFDPQVMDIVCRRNPSDELKVSFNIAPIWVLHSPTGMEWGYGGSGPADLALNILRVFGVERSLAEILHQDLKWAYVATLPREGGTIPGHAIRTWIAEQLRTPEVQQKVHLRQELDAIERGEMVAV